MNSEVSPSKIFFFLFFYANTLEIGPMQTRGGTIETTALFSIFSQSIKVKQRHRYISFRYCSEYIVCLCEKGDSQRNAMTTYFQVRTFEVGKLFLVVYIYHYSPIMNVKNKLILDL